MKLVATVSSPLAVFLPRKTMEDRKWILNLNVYRNTDRFTLNNVKIAYTDAMKKQITTLPNVGRVAVRFTLYPATRQQLDTPNICCVHDKFFMDAFVKAGKLEDDNFKFYVETGYKYGGVDKANPRVEIEIYEVS